MGAPLISVVLPTYNRAALLRRSIGSVLAQEVNDFELVVVDDGSTDDTAAAVAAIGDARVRYVRRRANGGVAAARNTGVAEARGRYLAFQDSDDEWLPRKLELQLADLAPLDGTAMSLCGLRRVAQDGKGTLFYPRKPSDWMAPLDAQAALRTVSYTQSWLVPRAAVLEAGGFDERLRVMDDWDLMIRLAMRLETRLRPEPLAISIRRDDSISVDQERFLHDMDIILGKYPDLFTRYPKEHSLLLFRYATRLLAAGRRTEARQHVLRSLRLAPTRPAAWRLLARALLNAGRAV